MSTNTSPTGFAVAGFASPQGQQGPSLSLVTKEEYLEVVGENNASEVKRGEYVTSFLPIVSSMLFGISICPQYHISKHLVDRWRVFRHTRLLCDRQRIDRLGLILSVPC